MARGGAVVVKGKTENRKRAKRMLCALKMYTRLNI